MLSMRPPDAHDEALAVALDIAGAAADIVALDRLDDVGERQPKRDELRRVGLHLILLDVAAERRRRRRRARSSAAGG